MSSKPSLSFLWQRLRRSAAIITAGGSWSVQLPDGVQRNMRWYFLDGVFSSSQEAINLTYLTLFVLALGASKAQIGLMTSLASLAAVALLIPGAVLAQRFGKRKWVVVASQLGLTLMVGHTFVYSPPVREVKRIIESGELGEVYFVTCSRVNLGLHQSDVSVVWDLAPHDLSILEYWLGETPLSVQAMGRSCINPNVPDVAFLSVRYASGIVAELQVSWLSPVKLRRTIVVGTKKMLMYDDTESVEKVKIFDAGNGAQLANLTGHADWVYRVAVTPDATKIASASADGTVKLWNLADNRLLATFLQIAPRTDEWLVWTPQGYLAAAPGTVQWKTAKLKTPPDKLATLLQNPEMMKQSLAGAKIAPPAVQ